VFSAGCWERLGAQPCEWGYTEEVMIIVGEDFLMRKWVVAIVVGLSIGLVGETQGKGAHL